MDVTVTPEVIDAVAETEKELFIDLVFLATVKLCDDEPLGEWISESDLDSDSTGVSERVAVIETEVEEESLRVAEPPGV